MGASSEIMPKGSIANSQPPNRYKTVPKRFCCRPTPYSFRDASVLRNLLKLREELEREFASSGSISCGGEPRQAFSIVNRLPLVHKSELATLVSLLSGYSDNDPLVIDGDRRPSLGRCKSCQSLINYSLIFGCEQQENWDIEKFTPTPLHVACLLPSPAPLVRRLVTEGVAINHPNHLGQTPLHALILGFCLPVLPLDSRPSLAAPEVAIIPSSEDALREAFNALLFKGASVSLRDDVGETPLLYVRNLLKEGLHQRANVIARLLLKAGANVHHQNLEGRTLLSYSIQYLDDSYSLTKTLLNHGCSVWGTDALGDTSAFKWLLKAIMSHRKVANCQNTLDLLSQLMCSQPSRMRALVTRMMSRHAKCYKIFGPVFNDIVSRMERHWTKPNTLISLCRITVRDSLISSYYNSVPSLPLPPQLQRYLLLEDDFFQDTRSLDG